MDAASSLDPKHILIIGAGPGLGVAVAHRYAREDFKVTLAARRENSLSALADELRAASAHVGTLIADASDQTAFRANLEDFGRKEASGVVVYNAAHLASDDILTSDADYLTFAYAVNVLGAITAAQVFTPSMRRARAGTFLTTRGVLALHPNREYATVSRLSDSSLLKLCGLGRSRTA